MTKKAAGKKAKEKAAVKKAEKKRKRELRLQTMPICASYGSVSAEVVAKAVVGLLQPELNALVREIERLQDTVEDLRRSEPVQERKERQQ